LINELHYRISGNNRAISLTIEKNFSQFSSFSFWNFELCSIPHSYFSLLWLKAFDMLNIN
jgi:hypothetical protein